MANELPEEILEREVQSCISKCSALKSLSEQQHYEAVQTALECILYGVNMRLEEIQDETEDDDE